jgi:hypothetical protein
MKIDFSKLSLLALTPAVLLALAGCKSAPEGEGATMAAAEKGVPGGVMVDTYEMTANVTAVDADKRKVTLVTQDGKKTVVKCGPEVVNFNQIQVGDQLKLTVTEELAVYMAETGAPAGNGEAALVALTPKGAKPGGMMAETVQVTAKVTAIDLQHRKATLQFPDGTSKTVPVRKDVDLTKRHVGEEVVIQTTEALALSVDKP